MIDIKAIIPLLKQQGCNAALSNDLKLTISDNALKSDMRIDLTDMLLYNANKSPEEIATMILNIYQHHKGIDQNINREFIMSNIHIALRRPENDNTIQKPTDFEHVSAYLCIYSRIGNDKQMEMKITPQILKQYGITEKEAWTQAEQNNKTDAVIESCDDILKKTANKETSYINLKIYTVTNKTKHYGTATILDKDILRQTLSKEKNTEWRMILMSKHYAVIIPNDDDPKTKALFQVIKNTEKTKTMPDDKLTAKTYILNL